ncbi:AAA family ATPase [Mucilaginibacter sp.]|uniref:AAA family ATPase n=1 Tax=Mucilaginibacter sp. TaxID=1882438 RepID=UPI002617613B|nr:AAA family ATPase [Mucilaginibacter sp.]MDB5032193.1 hypothetical protein [Mucilaginibacter sp.]
MSAVITLPTNNKFYEAYLEDGKALKELRSFSKINFFIGANNSGKSRLLRELLKDMNKYQAYQFTDQSYGVPYDFSIKGRPALVSYEPAQVLVLVKDRITQILALVNGSLRYRLESHLKGLKAEQLVEYDIYHFYAELITIGKAILKEDFEKANQGAAETRRKQQISALFNELMVVLQKLFPYMQGIKCTYVPAYRTLRKMLTKNTAPKEDIFQTRYGTYANYQAIQEPLLRTRTFFDYFLQINRKTMTIDHGAETVLLDPQHIFTGESMFEQIRQFRNSAEKERQKLVEYEEFLSTNFFNRQSVQLNALTIDEADDVYIKIGKEKEFPIYELGDGIQAIILLTFPLYINQYYNHFIFYEEPELYLHPGMQRIFVEVLSKMINTRAFIATHSNHFLDTIIDLPNEISVYTLRKLQDNPGATFQIELLSSPNVSLLNDLGIRNSSVLLANCTLWVEGISDRIYIKKFLDIYQREQPDGKLNNGLLREDLHFAFLEFGGNNIIHYDFSGEPQDTKISAHSISNRILLIHDLDKNKTARHQRLKKQLKAGYYQLDTLEIENLLSPEILKLTLQDFRIGNEPLVIADFKTIDYELRPIAEFIQEILPKGLKKIFTKPKGKAISKLYNKADFARAATAHMHSWADLSPKAQQLTKKVYEFILTHNQRAYDLH